MAKSSQFERIVGYVLFSLATSYAAWIAAVHFGLRFNVEPSVPIGAYHIVSGPVERGDTVGACLPSRSRTMPSSTKFCPTDRALRGCCRSLR